MPAIWLIDAYRAGERGQVRALAQTLASVPGWTLEILPLEYRTAVVWPHVFGASSLLGISARSAQQLRAPWPDLVITCGVRNEPVCRWLRRQSGGKTRYVHVGRPWGPLDQFDLVITTPQYRVPAYPNVLNNTLTLHQLDATSLQRAGEQAALRYAGLPEPYINVNLGGDSGPFTLGPNACRRLAKEASALAKARAASLLISTSARTPKAAVDAMEAELSVPYSLYRWRAGDADNPYLGMLGLASEIIVTADSIAMLSEACATGKPVHMFDLGGMRPGHDTAQDARFTARLYALLMRLFPQRLSRDITLVHAALIDAGLAAWLDMSPHPDAALSRRSGEANAAQTQTQTKAPVARSDLAKSVDAVRKLLGSANGAVDLD